MDLLLHEHTAKWTYYYVDLLLSGPTATWTYC